VGRIYNVFYGKIKQWIVVREEEDGYRISIPCRGRNEHKITKRSWEGQESAGLLTISPAIMCTACGLKIVIREGQIKDDT